LALTLALMLPMTPPRSLDYSAVTHPGLERDNNEDSLLSLPHAGIWLVADGMGGHEAGEVASAIVRDTVKKLADRNGNQNLGDMLQAAHQAVLRGVTQGLGAPGMGSTAVALHSQGRDYEVAWVGDSRAYLWTPNDEGGQLQQLTRDHSYVQLLLESGAITSEEMDRHPERNIITQCLGSAELLQVQVDRVQGQWQKNQWILLCSDGLSDEVDDKTIARILHESANCNTAADQLLHAALTQGGHDNISLQIIESPLRQRSPLGLFWRWVPYLTGNRRWDAWIYGMTLVSLLALLYSIIS